MDRQIHASEWKIMEFLWEESPKTLMQIVKAMGEQLYLDSGTLTPVLKKLEQKGYVSRARDTQDERVLNVTITEEGELLKEKAVEIPAKIGGCVSLPVEDALKLYEILQKILKNI